MLNLKVSRRKLRGNPILACNCGTIIRNKHIKEVVWLMVSVCLIDFFGGTEIAWCLETGLSIESTNENLLCKLFGGRGSLFGESVHFGSCPEPTASLNHLNETVSKKRGLI